VLTVNIDGANNLLTGIFKTALTGRRIEIGSSGATGEVNFYAPDGTRSVVRGFTSAFGSEAVHMSVPVSGASSAWNAFSVESSQNAFVAAQNIVNIFGGATTGGRSFAVDYASGKADLSTGRTTLLQITPDAFGSYFTEAGTGWFVSELPTGGGASFNRIWAKGGGDLYFYQRSSGGETVFFDRASNGSTAPRLWIHPTDNVLYHRDTGSFKVVERFANETFFNRLVIDTNSVYFQWPSTNARIQMNKRTAVPNSSPPMILVNNSGYGATLVYFDTGSGANAALEVQDASMATFIPVKASAFTVSSSAAGKEQIRDFAGGALAVLESARVKTWRRKKVRDADGNESVAESRQEIGFIAEEAPDVVRVDGGEHGPMIDLGSQTALNTAAIQEIAALLRRKGVL
jgi:hypothetical protein